MTTDQTAIGQPAGMGQAVARPYPPSWVDRFTDWVERLPGSGWFVYVGLLLVEFAYVNAMRWANGRATVGDYDLRASAEVFFNVFALVVIVKTDAIAAAALAAFRPALGIHDDEYRRLRYELTNMPARGTALVFLLGALAAIPSAYSIPADVIGQFAPSAAAFLAQFGILHAANLSLLAVALYHTVRQLQRVNHIHALAARIDMFQPEPLYAFSRLTAWTATFYLIAVAYALTLRTEVILHSPSGLAFLALSLPLAIVFFVLPLLGMQRRLADEKQRLESDINRRLQAAITDLQRRMDAGDLKEINLLQSGMASLVLSLDVVSKKPTWPWQPGTFRGFLSALLLPVVVWLVQVWVQRLTGL